MAEVQEPNEKLSIEPAEQESPEQVAYEQGANGQMGGNNDFEHSLEQKTYEPKSLSTFLSAIKIAIESSQSDNGGSNWTEGLGETRYILHTIRPKILQNGDYYLAELQHDLGEMQLDENMRNKIYDSLNIPTELRAGYHEVVIVKVNEDDKAVFEGVLDKYK